MAVCAARSPDRPERRTLLRLVNGGAPAEGAQRPAVFAGRGEALNAARAGA